MLHIVPSHIVACLCALHCCIVACIVACTIVHCCIVACLHCCIVAYLHCCIVALLDARRSHCHKYGRPHIRVVSPHTLQVPHETAPDFLNGP